MSDPRNSDPRAEWLREEMLRRRPSLSRFHPGEEELATYAEGGLAEARRGEIQEHLLTCDECGGLVLELTAALAEPEPEVSAEEIEAGWRRLRPRLSEAGLPTAAPEGPNPATPLVAPAKVRRRSGDGWRALAAALVVALLGSGTLNVWQWKEAESSREIRPVRWASLSVMRSSAPVDATLEADDGSGGTVAFRIRGNPDDVASVRFELRRKGSLVGVGEARSIGDELLALIPGAWLEPGIYRLKLADGREFRIEMTPPAGS
jgi:anti-sigma factor RsiW